MNLISFNVRWLGSGPKRAALKESLDKLKPGVILLQEIMTNVGTACEIFLKIKLEWKASAWDYSGIFGGMLVC